MVIGSRSPFAPFVRDARAVLRARNQGEREGDWRAGVRALGAHKRERRDSRWYLHFVRALYAPDIGALVVLLLVDNLRRHVIRSAEVCLREARFAAKLLREAEVAELHVPGAVEQHVRRLEVAVQDRPAGRDVAAPPAAVRDPGGDAARVAVALLERENDLAEHAHHACLVDVLSLRLVPLDQRGEVAARAVLHHDEELGRRLVDDPVVIPHDIRMAQLAQDVDLGNDLLLFPLVHQAIVQLLPNQILQEGRGSSVACTQRGIRAVECCIAHPSIALAADLAHDTERSLAERPDASIPIHDNPYDTRHTHATANSQARSRRSQKSCCVERHRSMSSAMSSSSEDARQDRT